MIEPTSQIEFSPAEVQRLRAAHYNATLAAVLPVHSDLRIFRIVADAGLPPLEAGQFMTLGLGNWEPRVEGVDEEQIDVAHYQRLAKRAYSVSCSVLDDGGSLRRISEFPYLEFYVVLVRHGRKRPPSLTPRLFALHPGDRLFVERHAAGNYTLENVRPDNNVFFFATGTGEAPHNAMIAELLARGHRGRIISVVSVRYFRDAAYRVCHEELMRRFPNYRHFVLTTRERLANEPWSSSFGCLCHLQDLIVSRQLELHTGVALEPKITQVFLCGNSEMIGAEHVTAASVPGVKPGSMLDVLLERGFQLGQGERPGNVHFERYW